MKPLTLTLQAFGSYGEKTVVDFTKPDQNLFLVTGNTGSGKSTIFDGIVFALYGEAGSQNVKKEGFVLQSDYVGYEVEPKVILTFAESNTPGAKIYTVERSPRHKRPIARKSSKGNTFVDVPETVVLTLPDGSELSTKETDEKIVQIVGLTKKQFMQVAMIAQGEFMDVLRQETKDKKVVFRHLFKTEFYDQIRIKLDARLKEEERKLDIIKAKCSANASKVEIPENYYNADKFSMLCEEIKAGELANIEEFVAELKNITDYLTEREDSERTKAVEYRKDRDSKRDAVVKAEELVKHFDKCEEAKKLLAECEAKNADIEEKKKLVKEISNSYEISKTYEIGDVLGKEYEELKSKQALEEKKLPEYIEAAKQCEEKELKAREELDIEKKKLTQIEEKVDQAIEILKKKEKAEADYQKKKAEYDKANAQYLKEKEKLENLDSEEIRINEEIERLEMFQIEKIRWEKDHESYVEIKRLRDEYNSDRTTCKKLHEEFEKEKEAYEIAKAEFNNNSIKYNEEYNAFIDNQAGFLAKTELKKGFPCPVCGSLEHPSPRIAFEGRPVYDKKKLAELREKTEKCKDLLDEKSILVRELGMKASMLDAKIEESYKIIYDKMSAVYYVEEETFAALNDAIKAFGKSLEDKKAQIDESVILLEKLKKEKETNENRKAIQKELLDKHENTVKNLNEEKIAAETTLAHYSDATEYENLEEAKKVKSLAKLAKEEKEDECRILAKKTKEAIEKKTESETLIAKYKNEVPKKEVLLLAKEKEYFDILEKYGLTAERWKELVGLYEKEKIDEWTQYIEEETVNREKARTLFTSEIEVIGDNKRPDLDELSQLAEEADKKAAEQDTVLDGVRSLKSANSKALADFETSSKERTKTVITSAKVKNLYNMVAGKNTGKRMDLETFVLRTYLKQILSASNARLYKMSAGQYELRMVELERASEGSNKGLDLMVYSFSTGKEREIKTLSGGESFMAALALALGMADQIQADTTAINLDIMFLDEGFGSLDDHSRSEAVKVLKQMAEGSKLIGIISHVTELKQEIDNQLVVTKDDKGSHVKWITN